MALRTGRKSILPSEKSTRKTALDAAATLLKAPLKGLKGLGKGVGKTLENIADGVDLFD
jgi:hypothetical protein